jgi:pimeloyl-ACP methyl ester carboxylesterase
LELAADAILALQARFGPFAGAATHSFGGPALAKAFQQGLELDQVVLISPPVAQARQFERAWRRYGVEEPMIEAALALGHQEGRFFDLAAAAPSMKADALFIHSLDDEQCPASEGKRAAEAWPGARFWSVDGLGHRALVQDEEVVSMVAGWLDA